MTWNARAYMRFGDQRTRPARDLAAHVVVEAPRNVIDLGCGPGNSTEVLRRRWPTARVVGLDSSAEMIAAAREGYPHHEWVLDSADAWTADAPFDVVFSNAALQWLPDHETLMPRLLEQVAPGGAFAFQIPARDYSPVAGLIDEVIRYPEWDARMRDADPRLTMEDASFYYDVLCDVARTLDMWETTYIHVMEDAAAIVEWMSSTGLRPYLAALPDDTQRGRFTAMLTERVAEAYPPARDGRVLFPFRRLLVIAYR